MSPKCEWTNMDATSSAYAEGEEVPQHEWCERMATSISCVPCAGNLTCDLHKCRCAKPLEAKARSVVGGPMNAIEILTRDRDEWKKRASDAERAVNLEARALIESSRASMLRAQTAETALSNVSGALVDSGVVVPAVEWRYGEAVRGIVAERDALRARVGELEAQLAVEEVVSFRGQVAELEERLAVYEAATAVEFLYDEDRDLAMRAEFFCGTWQHFRTDIELGENDERTIVRCDSRDAAIAKAFELSKAGSK